MKKHITRMFAIVMAIAMVLSLTACGHEHEWLDASCTAPKTCASCEETEGEALGHAWADATCDAPKTCSVCGETEGEPIDHSWVDAACEVPKTCSVCAATEGEALGHTWVDANYQAPKTCSVCGATEGEALVSYFAEHGLDAKLLDKSGTYELPLACSTDTSKTTIAKVTVADYKTIASDETHEAQDGYEWKILSIKLHLDDDNAWNYGASGPHYLWENRYIGEPAGDDENEGLFENGMKMSFVWNGIEYNDGLLHIAESVSGWLKDEAGTNYVDFDVTISVRVPVGCDGFVFGLETTGWEWPDGTYLHEVITDGTLLFNFD